MVVRAAGPLGRVIKSDGAAVTPGDDYRLPGYQFEAGANALVMLHRVAFFDEGTGKLADSGQRALLRWAWEHGLGQDGELVGYVTARRERAVAELRRQGHPVVRLRAEPEWRLAIGLGNKANAHEIGLSLHGTYGWPVIPGSSLKGLSAAWAVTSGVDAADVRRVLGSPRLDVPDSETDPQGETGRARAPKGGAARGTVRFLDAVPAAGPVQVVVDVLTPHVKAYYETSQNDGGGPAVPPAEYHNPVPVNFLAVSGAFAVDLHGHCQDDVDLAAEWLIKAGEDLGAGGKTAAGYGFLSVTPVLAEENKG